MENYQNCSMLYDGCAKWYTYTCEHFLKMSVGLGLVFVCLSRFSILCVFLF